MAFEYFCSFNLQYAKLTVKLLSIFFFDLFILKTRRRVHDGDDDGDDDAIHFDRLDSTKGTHSTISNTTRKII